MTVVGVTESAKGPSRRRADLEALAVGAVVAVGVGLITGLSRAADLNKAGLHHPLWVPLLEDQISVLVLVALLPLVLALLRRAPLMTGPLWRWLGAHAAATLPFSLIHVTAMGVIRWIVFTPLGVPHAPFDPLRDFLYEYRKDVLTYATMVLFATLLWAWRRGPEASGSAEPGIGAEAPIEVRDGARRFYVRPAEIAWIEAAGNYAELHLAGRSLLQRASLSALEARLAAAGFVRIHRARLVNRAEVAGLQTNAAGDFTVTLRDGRTLAGSRRYRAALTGPPPA